jgi:hypothetical protein
MVQSVTLVSASVSVCTGEAVCAQQSILYLHLSNGSKVFTLFGCSTICFIGLTRACATTAVAMRPARVYIVVSYRWGVGSRVPGGARSMSLLIERVLVASSWLACSIGAPKAAWKVSGDI